MENQRWRLLLPGGLVLGWGAAMLLACPVFGIVYREPLFFILLIPATGWVIGGYVVLRATKYTGMRVAGVAAIGFSIVAVMTLLGSLVMRLAGE